MGQNALDQIRTLSSDLEQNRIDLEQSRFELKQKGTAVQQATNKIKFLTEDAGRVSLFLIHN